MDHDQDPSVSPATLKSGFGFPKSRPELSLLIRKRRSQMEDDEFAQRSAPHLFSTWSRNRKYCTHLNQWGLSQRSCQLTEFSPHINCIQKQYLSCWFGNAHKLHYALFSTWSCATGNTYTNWLLGETVLERTTVEAQWVENWACAHDIFLEQCSPLSYFIPLLIDCNM
jgi:hypothetical protein